MTKNTIKKAFHKDFVHNIWKMEVDGYSDKMAVEIRNAETTRPTFVVIDYKFGNTIMNYTTDSKEWTMEGVQKDYLVLKQVGEQTPTKEGIQIICISEEKQVMLSYEYVLLEMFEDYLLVRPRSFTQGGEQLLRIADGQRFSIQEKVVNEIPINRVNFPIPYAEMPIFFADEPIQEQLWLSKIDEKTFAWAYHTKDKSTYDLHLAISTTDTIVDTEIVQTDLKKMFPQPYFQVDDRLFFLADNKHEIVSYLV
ncbi:hypothetical protein ACFSQ3_01490 [Sphingobacterium corticis]|uniref:DUF4905 domain-containing protein n=1 Tax=Sphingobacterium corticis TaxID=1812823 RepID=A0ABW5NEQ8_9SPHI